MKEDLVCFVAQKAFIKKNDELLILHDPRMGLDLPGGKIMVGEEDLKAALLREVKEETGLIIKIGEPFSTWFFTIPLNSGHQSAGKKIFTVGYRCEYVSGEVNLSQEHDWYKWINKTNYKQYLKKSAFSSVLKEYFGS